MSDTRRWNVYVETGKFTTAEYKDAYLLLIENGVLQFHTHSGRTVITTMPYRAEEIKP